MTKTFNVDKLITQIVKGIEDNKGVAITLLDLREIEHRVCDYFIICSGASNMHVSSIAEAIQKKVRKELHEKPWHCEGEQIAEWILLDYVNVVVHIFQKPVREHYDLEGLWGDAKIITFTETA